MQPAGLKEVEAAKADGRWKRAYDSPSTATIPEEFLRLLSKNKKASSFFKKLKRADIYAIAYRIQTAKKEETRTKRMNDIVDMLARGESFHLIQEDI